ncbi:MAG: BREX-2 system phosphatase PglZ [Nocardiopsaceae bacterium]|nr:BREX-2 system phosphatase PglZ [Nocardiopsaceae bacterium]
MELVANKSVVELELKRALGSSRTNKHNKVLLLRAAPEWQGDTELSVDAGGGVVPVTVVPCKTVLAVLDALSADHADDGYLVILTPCDTRDVGESVLARALRPEIKPVDRWDLVRETFGARHLDPALTKHDNRWIAEALLDAQPAGGWRRLNGPVLTRATALNRLAATRLGIDDADDSAIDAAALLQWTLEPSAVARFTELRKEERDGLVDWLAGTVGPVADVVFRMTAAGRVKDAVPFGLVAGVLYGSADEQHQGGQDAVIGSQADPGVTVARVRAEERYLGGSAPGMRALRAFGVAAESLVTRWAENDHAEQAARLCERAEAIIDELSGTEAARRGLASRSAVLEAGMDARVNAFAEALAAALAQPGTATLASAAEALRNAKEHGRKRDHDADLRAAEAAVRLARWLAAAEEPPATLADAATRMLRSWGWADRLLNVIERADTSRVPRLGEVYRMLGDRARDRRATLDEAFARKLADWTEAGSGTDLLCVENLLERIARPVAAKRLPLIVVLDGMGVAVATELAEEFTSRGAWQEAGRLADGREPVLATVRSVTAISLTSLLTGRLMSGGQSEENAGFARFWGRQKAVLFHEADLAPEPGAPLTSRVRDAIQDSSAVVGIVLNTIDDALGKGKPGGPANWTAGTVTYLHAVLDEARRAGRPVILTADHGHHGGASPAEAVVPVITLFPPDAQVPSGWTKYDAIGHAPSWWTIPSAARAPTAEQAPAPSARPQRKRAKAAPEPDGDALFGVSDVLGLEKTASLGTQVADSPRMTAQRTGIPRAPEKESVAALIDALVQAGGRLTRAEAAAVVGQPPVRMSGYLAQITRLLNVDGYAVLQATEDGRAVELNAQLLRQQFMTS